MTWIAFVFRLGVEQPTLRVTLPTLFSTSTCRQIGTRATGQTGAWPPRVKWTRDDNSISGVDITRDPDLSQPMHFVPCRVSLFVLLLLLL